MSRVGIVAALAVEARALTPSIQQHRTPFELEDGTLLNVSGIGDAAANDAALALVDAGANALISFGLAGGLDPALRAGAICLPVAVCTADREQFETSSVWRDRVAAALAEFRPVTGGKLLTSPQVVATVVAKQAMFRNGGALAVDMESAAVGRIAMARGLPFLIVRVVVDTAADVLPACVMAANGTGELHIGRLMAGLTRSPKQIVDVIRLARRFRIAQAALRAVGRSRSLREVAGP